LTTLCYISQNALPQRDFFTGGQAIFKAAVRAVQPIRLIYNRETECFPGDPDSGGLALTEIMMMIQ
jgi:hypothetical protein